MPHHGIAVADFRLDGARSAQHVERVPARGALQEGMEAVDPEAHVIARDDGIALLHKGIEQITDGDDVIALRPIRCVARGRADRVQTCGAVRPGDDRPAATRRFALRNGHCARHRHDAALVVDRTIDRQNVARRTWQRHRAIQRPCPDHRAAFIQRQRRRRVDAITRRASESRLCLRRGENSHHDGEAETGDKFSEDRHDARSIVDRVRFVE